MAIIHLKPFQEKAIADLRKQFLELWKTTNRKLPLVFKAPTGSGKTVMVAQFLKDMSNDPQFNVDKSYLWFSFSEESYEQSKDKLFDYYGGANEINLLDLNDLSKGKLEKNNVFFINWQKIKSSTKEGRRLRNPTEYTYGDGIFDEEKRLKKEGKTSPRHIKFIVKLTSLGFIYPIRYAEKEELNIDEVVQTLKALQ